MNIYHRGLTYIILISFCSISGIAQSQVSFIRSGKPLLSTTNIAKEEKQLSPNQEYRIYFSSKKIMGNMRIISVSDQYLKVQQRHSPDSIRIELHSLTGIRDEYYLQKKRSNLAQSIGIFAVPTAVVAGVIGIIINLGFEGEVYFETVVALTAIGAGGGAVVGLGVGTLWNTIRYYNQSVLFRRFDRYTNEEKQAIIQTHVINNSKP